jgi:hypothetical protein
MNRMTRQKCSRSFERGFDPYFGPSWDHRVVENLISLLMAVVNGTSCGNRYKACSASPPDHPVWVFYCALFGEKPRLLLDLNLDLNLLLRLTLIYLFHSDLSIHEHLTSTWFLERLKAGRKVVII